MKFPYFILVLLILSSCLKKKEPAKDILSEKKFIHLLTELHLAQAAFEISTSKNIEDEVHTLENFYASVYSKNKISANVFQKSMSYYIQDPEKLDSMYNITRKNIEQKKAILDQK